MPYKQGWETLVNIVLIFRLVFGVSLYVCGFILFASFLSGRLLESWGVLLYGLSWYGRANVRTHFRLCVIFMELLSN